MKSKEVPEHFQGFLYPPSNEQEVVGLFFNLLPELDLSISIEKVRTAFPDCLAWRQTESGPQELKIEFELFSQNFKEHGHQEDKCDIIVCWEDNWQSCPLEVLALKEKVQALEGKPIYFDHQKYSPSTWTQDSFLNRVENKFPQLFPLQKKLLDGLEARGISIISGKGEKEATYSFYIPFTENKTRTGVNEKGSISLEFKDTPENLKRRLAAGFLYELGIEIDPTLSWTRAGILGKDITEDEIEKFLNLISKN